MVSLPLPLPPGSEAHFVVPSRETIHGLPVWTLDTLPKPYKEILSRVQYIKPWRRCKRCGEPGRYYCKQCGSGTAADKTRYCSRSCQRKDWKRHKEHCLAVARVEKKLGPEFTRQSHKQGMRWSNALLFALGWAVRQAYLQAPPDKRRDVMFFIDLMPVIPEDAQSPVWACTFEFMDADWNTPDLPPLPDFSGPYGLYTVSINDTLKQTGWIPLEITGPYTAIPPRPHWPYIISHCCLVGDINPDVARIRLKLILDTLNTYNDRHGVLDEFVVPSFTGKFEMEYEKLKKWMSIMYPVVGCLRSRFHSPCDIVSRSFDHLLKPDV